jgi:transcriptional regulator with XRE-family HTH domain
MAYLRGYSLAELAVLTHASQGTLRGMIGILRNYMPGTVAEVVLLYDQEDHSQEEIAEITGISQTAVSNILGMYKAKEEIDYLWLKWLRLKEWGRGDLKKQPTPKLYDYRRVVAQYRGLAKLGMTIQKLNEKTGAPTRTLQRMMEPVTLGKKIKLAQKIVRLRLQGLTQTKIAHRTGASQPNVHKILLELQDANIDGLNFKNYAKIIDKSSDFSYRRKSPKIQSGDGESERKKQLRIEQLRALPRANKKNYSSIIPRWQILGHAMGMFYDYWGTFNVYRFPSREEYFKHMSLPIKQVEILAKAYKEIDKGSVIKTLPAEDVDDLIADYYERKKRMRGWRV